MRISAYVNVITKFRKDYTMNDLMNIFKVLSDETRLRVISLLFYEDLCVCEFSGILDIPQPKISKALSKLRDLNLVTDRRQDKFVFYSLKRGNELLIHILDYIANNVDKYPQLAIDKSNLPLAERFLNQCCVK